MKVIIGVGRTVLDGWISTQEDELNLLRRDDFEQSFAYTTNNILSEK